MGVFSRIFNGLHKTKKSLEQKFDGVFENVKITDDFYEEIECILLSSDLGSKTTEKIIQELKDKVKKEKLKYTIDCKKALKEIMINILENNLEKNSFPVVFLVVGVNGVGKTTTIGKLAKQYTNLNKKVIIAAADTFRAAASEQLNVWAERAKVQIVKSSTGADPASVVFDAINSFKAKKADVLIIDTAGRLHNKKGLMLELEKISKIVKREIPEADYKKIIVLDATTGQNALEQVKSFDEAVGLSGIIITKLDGTAKGGVVFAIANEYNLPIMKIGVGESVDDLLDFNAKEFVDSIL